MIVPEYSLEGKVVLLTGAGRGIGAGIAEVFAGSGATVVVNALTDKYAAPLAARLQKQTGRRAVAVPGDATTMEGAARLVAQATDQAGPIDVLVNALGDAISGKLVPLPTDKQTSPLSDADIRKVLDINLTSAIYCAQAVAGGMIARKRGRIINISSTAAFQGTAGHTIYATAKAGLTGLTKSLALDWAAHGITVNAIAPGVFPDRANWPAETIQQLEKSFMPRVPLGRFGLVREVGLLALYLASDASNYMTGQTLALDGGLSV